MKQSGPVAIMIARWVSIVCHPFPMIILLVAVVASRRLPPLHAAGVVLVVAVITLLPLGILIALQVSSGRWGNVDASDRRERPPLFLLAAALAILTGLLFLRVGALAFMTRGIAAVLALVAIAAIVNTRMKLSLHIAFATYVAVTLLKAEPAAGAAVLALIPALAWSRLALSRHTPAELILGGLAGAAVAVIAILV